MLTQKEQEAVAGFRQWAKALASDDNQTMRALERVWYKDTSKYHWSTQEERDAIILGLYEDGCARKRIAYELQIPYYWIEQAIRRQKRLVKQP